MNEGTKPATEITMDERTAKAVALLVERKDLQSRITAFVGESELKWDEGEHRLREIASEGVMAAAAMANYKPGK